jgi:hypothetical protein
VLKNRWFCAHCGNQVRGYAITQGQRVCHTGTVPAQSEPLDCYRLVTVYGEELGSRMPEDSALVDVLIRDVMVPVVPVSHAKWGQFLKRHGRDGYAR